MESAGVVFPRLDAFPRATRAQTLLLTAALYFTLVFGTAFILGVIRELWLVPRWGATAGIAIEAPVLLIVMVAAARYALGWTNFLRWHLWTRLAIGLFALALQQTGDVLVAVFLQGMSLSGYLLDFGTPRGAIYLFLLAALVVVPALVRRDQRS